jgi:hypothetical protein
MKIEIKDRFERKRIIVCGEYESIKDCLEKNLSADLRSADLSRANLSRANLSRADLSLADLRLADLYVANLSLANLRSADLRSADLRSAYLYSADLCSADLSFADLRSADLRSADLSRANLSRANLSRADLSSADLSSANLTDIKNYSESHDIFQELCRQQDSKTFTEAEWSMIGFICIHRICWEAIHKRYGKKVMSVFKKLENKGWKEYAEKYAGVLKESKQ